MVEAQVEEILMVVGGVSFQGASLFEIVALLIESDVNIKCSRDGYLVF